MQELRPQSALGAALSALPACLLDDASRTAYLGDVNQRGGDAGDGATRSAARETLEGGGRRGLGRLE